jgi:erythromycin esterase-like protein
VNTARTPQQIAAEIAAWNLRDVRDLRNLLAELRACRDERGDEIDFAAYGVDTTNLPSAPIPEWVDTGYPVWAVDVDGMALVGGALDEVESLDQIAREC